MSGGNLHLRDQGFTDTPSRGSFRPPPPIFKGRCPARDKGWPKSTRQRPTLPWPTLSARHFFQFLFIFMVTGSCELLVFLGKFVGWFPPKRAPLTPFGKFYAFSPCESMTLSQFFSTTVFLFLVLAEIDCHPRLRKICVWHKMPRGLNASQTPWAPFSWFTLLSPCPLLRLGRVWTCKKKVCVKPWSQWCSRVLGHNNTRRSFYGNP